MRPIVALYVGGMGSREQNFYNRLVSSYGFEEAAEKVQGLYLAGQKTEAMFALPDELIDLVCIVGPRDRVKAKLRAFADAGVDTLIRSEERRVGKEWRRRWAAERGEYMT